MRWRSLLLALAAASASEAAAQVKSTPGSFVGCYVVQLEAWTPALMEGNRLYQLPPDTVHLTNETGIDTGSPIERGRLLARPVIPHGRTPSAFWTQEDSRSVQVMWTNGHAGVRLDLAPDGDGELVGEAEAFTDVLTNTPPAATVALRKVNCSN